MNNLENPYFKEIVKGAFKEAYDGEFLTHSEVFVKEEKAKLNSQIEEQVNLLATNFENLIDNFVGLISSSVESRVMSNINSSKSKRPRKANVLKEKNTNPFSGPKKTFINISDISSKFEKLKSNQMQNSLSISDYTMSRFSSIEKNNFKPMKTSNFPPQDTDRSVASDYYQDEFE